MPSLHQLERTFLVIAALVIIVTITSLAWPFAAKGLPSGHDATAHITYTFLFDRALRQGQVPVRWVEWVRSGESQPLFNFYPPGLYYLIESVHLVVPRLSTAFKSSVVLVWWAGALFTFVWLRPLGWMAAGLAAVMFAWSPYVIVDVFVRAAYPELAAIALAPGILWSIDRLIKRARLVDGLLVGCFVGAMLTCHLLSSLVFAPVIASYAAYRLFTAPEPWRRGGLLAGGVAMGVGLSAFYLLPSMAELGHVAIGRMTSGYSDYRQHFVEPAQWFSWTWGYGGSGSGQTDGMPMQIDVLQWLVIGAAIVRLVLARGRSGPLAFWLTVVASAMFLMSAYSAPLWRAIPALPFLQFPWRYFMVISLGAAALAGLLLASIPSRLQALLVIAVIGSQYQLHHDHLKPLHYISRATMNIDSPRWPETEVVGVKAFIERGFTPIAARREAPDTLGRWTIVAGSGDVREQRIADDAVDLAVVTATGARLRINSHYFPGWAILVNGEPADVDVDPLYGFMEVTLPPGTHGVDARFTNTLVRTLANAISIVSLAIVGIVLARSRLGRFTMSGAISPG